MVRLKGFGPERCGRVSIQFQSHCGAIKSRGPGIAPGPTQIRFNPTVVRLKVDYSAIIPAGDQPFQSHCGAIKRREAAEAALLDLSFNPTVVRLKALIFPPTLLRI